MSFNILVNYLFFFNGEKLKTKLLFEFFIIKKLVLKVSFMERRDTWLL